MNLLSIDNRDLAEIETELRARIEVQKIAIELERKENSRLRKEVQRLKSLIRVHHRPSPEGGNRYF
jgi:predicted transcriptional regulator